MILRWVAVLMMCACGPAVANDDDGTTGDATTDGSASTQSQTSSSSTTMPPQTTEPSTISTSGNPTTTDTTVDPDTGGTGCNFLGCDLDVGPALECDLWVQDCPVGEKCMPWANDGGPHWNATRCSPITPDPASIGESCLVEGSYMSGIDTCDLGSMCLFVDPETNAGECVANCQGSLDYPVCKDPANGCSIDFQGTMINCLPWCDPLLQDCAQGGCHPTAFGEFVCGPTFGDGAATGDECLEDWDCAAGTLCVAADQLDICNGSSCCASICDIEMPEQCDGGSCMPWYTEGSAPPGFETVGICTA